MKDYKYDKTYFIIMLLISVSLMIVSFIVNSEMAAIGFIMSIVFAIRFCFALKPLKPLIPDTHIFLGIKSSKATFQWLGRLDWFRKIMIVIYIIFVLLAIIALASDCFGGV